MQYNLEIALRHEHARSSFLHMPVVFDIYSGSKSRFGQAGTGGGRMDAAVGCPVRWMWSAFKPMAGIVSLDAVYRPFELHSGRSPPQIGQRMWLRRLIAFTA